MHTIKERHVNTQNEGDLLEVNKTELLGKIHLRLLSRTSGFQTCKKINLLVYANQAIILL
jgi:hypothetical protein